MSFDKRYIIGFLLISFLSPNSPAASEDEPSLAEYFGFLPVEVYKLDNRISNLIVKDLDGDKTDDILVVNNGRSRIDLLLSSKKEGTAADPVQKLAVNQPVYDKRMRLVSIPVNKEVVSIATGDFNSDGMVDLAYYGTPAELVVMTGNGKGKFTETRKITTGEAIESSGSLTIGDLNRDGRDDIAILASNDVIAVFQDANGKLGEPQKLPHTGVNPRFLKTVDLDGDGGDDLLFSDGGNDDPIRVRFSTAEGRLGPEQRFTIDPLRAYAFANLDGKPGAEMMTIDSQSGRVRISKLEAGESDQTDKNGRLIIFPLAQGNTKGRSLSVGDLDGDGKADVVATDPSNAQFFVYRQSAKNGLGTSENFPGLVGGKTVKLADLDGDGKSEVYVLSEQEKQIAQSKLVGSRLSFPSPLPTKGDPLAFDVADLDGDKVPEIVYISRVGSNTSEGFQLNALKLDASGKWVATESVPVKGLSGAPPALRVLDINRDGRPDFLIFNAFGQPVLLLGQADAAPQPGTSLGSMAAVTPAGLTVTDLNGPAVLIAQSSFARNVFLSDKGEWEIKDQYISGKTAAQVVGVAALDTDHDGVKEIVLFDRQSKNLLFLKAKDGVYRPSGTISVGSLDFQGMHVADFDGDGKDDLLIAGTERFGVVLTGRAGQRLKTIASYEATREKARFGDLIAGDLNGDGRIDIALIDVTEHFVEIVTYDPPSTLQRAVSFKVFEQKSFRDVDSLIEPRDIQLGDVNGDRRTDIVLIVHDRVLVYRQDVVEQPAKPVKDQR